MWISRRSGEASILLVAAALLLGGSLFLPHGTQPPGDPGSAPAAMPVFAVRMGKFRGKLVETGFVWADGLQESRCPYKGRAIIKRIVPDGTRVKKGEFVCELDLSEIRAGLDQALTAAREAEIAYRDARRTREAALAKLVQQQTSTDDKATRELTRELDRERSEETRRLSAWERTKDEVGRYPAKVPRSTTIVAPDDGPVLLAGQTNPNDGPPYLNAGETVSGGQQLFTLFDVDREIRLPANVPGPMIERVKLGLPALVTVDGFPERTLSGVVGEISPLPHPAVSGIRIPQYGIRIKIERGFPGLRPNMRAKVEIELDEATDVLSVPVEAVAHDGGRDWLAVRMSDGTFDWREVAVGATTDTLIEILRGIRRGEFVARNPTGLMSEKRPRSGP